MPDEPAADGHHFTAADGTTVHYRRWLPTASTKAAIQIIHGAAEHAGRYDRFARAAVASGHAVYATDHRGHGRTRLRSGRTGDAGPDAWNRMVDDEVAFSQRLRAASRWAIRRCGPAASTTTTSPSAMDPPASSG